MQHAHEISPVGKRILGLSVHGVLNDIEGPSWRQRHPITASEPDISLGRWIAKNPHKAGALLGEFRRNAKNPHTATAVLRKMRPWLDERHGAADRDIRIAAGHRGKTPAHLAVGGDPETMGLEPDSPFTPQG